jgi:hypothetical protein
VYPEKRPWQDINRAMVDVRRGDTIKAVLWIGEV